MHCDHQTVGQEAELRGLRACLVMAVEVEDKTVGARVKVSFMQMGRGGSDGENEKSPETQQNARSAEIVWIAVPPDNRRARRETR